MDKPWRKYYKPHAEKEVLNAPTDQTVWDVIEKSLYEHIDIPAIEYFGKVISRKTFIDHVYLWAKVFRKLGVKEDEVVAYYGPFMPDTCYMIFALNMLGACPYFLKLAITPEALAEETKECRLAIVFDQMWDKVSGEFSKDRFEKVIIAKITDAMPSPKKQIVSVLSGAKGGVRIPKAQKYISVPEARKLAGGDPGDGKVPFAPGRKAFITSSSGTTLGGIVKGVVATNESAVTQLYMAAASGCQYFPGERCLNHFPPTAATSLNILFMLPLFRGMTVVMDPRVSEKDFYNQVTKYHANVICTTGSAWEAFFNRVARNMEKGMKYDFSYAKSWVVGGEGTSVTCFKKWQKLMKKAGSDRGVASAYGASEVFASACSEFADVRYNFSKPIMSVGIPFVGITAGVFDSKGNECSYNQRGELWIKSPSAMKEYYRKPDLTSRTMIDGWIHTGDQAEIDENGFVYIWGRKDDTVKLPDGREIYLFDIEHRIKEKPYIDDAAVLQLPGSHGEINVVVHIAWDQSAKESDAADHLAELNQEILKYEPGVRVCAYAIHDGMLPYSPTTLKRDRHKMADQRDGLVRIADGKLVSVSLS